jgi:uncharacterized protein (TIGR02300 family)
VVKPDWGTKRKCLSCGIPFYDLKKKSIECPNCGAIFNTAPQTRPRRPTPATPKPKEEKSIVSDEMETIEKDSFLETSTPDLNDEIDDAEDDDADDSLIEDTSDLSSADDEIPNIKENNEYGVEE